MIINLFKNKIIDLFKRKSTLVDGTKKHFVKLLSKQKYVTELNYLDSNFFSSRIYDIKKFDDSVYIELSQNAKAMKHQFAQRNLVTLLDVVIDNFTGLIYVFGRDNNLYLLKESSIWPSESLIINRPKSDPMILQAYDQLNMGLPNVGFYHLITDYLGKLIIHKKLNNNVVFANVNKLAFQRSIYDFFEFRYIKCPRWIRVKELTFIDGGLNAGYLHPTDLQNLKLVSPKLSVRNSYHNSKIYISRLMSRRSNINEKNLQTELEKNGFEVVFPEKLSFGEQVSIFKNAKLIIGLHGAGLVNSIWSEKPKVIELMPLNRINKCFEWITLLNGGTYSRIDYKPWRTNTDILIKEILKRVD